MNAFLQKWFLKCSFAIFFAMCLFHYFSQRPLWLDEGYVFSSVKSFSYPQFFGVLEVQQSFPRIYLVCVTFISRMFDLNLLALRFLPLLSMLAAFFVWRKVYQLSLEKGTAFVLCMLSFVCSYRMMYYAAELKHYSMDVLAVGIITLFLIHQNQYKEKSPDLILYLASALLPLLIFFSYAAVLILWMVGFNYLVLVLRNRKFIAPLVIFVATAVISWAVLYAIDLKYSMYTPGLYSYWKDYFIDVRSLYGFIAPLGEGYLEIVTWYYGNIKLLKKMAMALVPLFSLSLFWLAWRGWRAEGWGLFKVERIFVVLFLQMIVLSILKRYPFTGDRITLFFAPFVFYFVVKAIEYLKKWKPAYLIVCTYYVVFLLMCWIVGLKTFVGMYG